MIAAVPHQPFFDAVVQIIPLLFIVAAIERRSFWGRTPGTYNLLGGVIVLVALVAEILALVQLLGGTEENRHAFVVISIVVAFAAILALFYFVVEAAARPRDDRREIDGR